MKLTVNKTVLDLCNPANGTIVPFAEYVLKYYWNKLFPVDIYYICQKLGIDIVYTTDVNISGNNCQNKIIYINSEYFKNKHIFYLNLELSVQLGFILRNINSNNLDRNSDIFKNQIKQARHLLMPDDVLIEKIILKKNKNELYDKFKNIPEYEVDEQLEKIRRKISRR